MDRFRDLSVQERRLTGAAAVAAAVVVIVAGVLLTSAPTPRPPVAAASASLAPSARIGTGASASGGASALPGTSQAPDGDWAAFNEPAFEPLVALTADALDASGVAPTSGFTLHAKAPLDAPSLARSLQVTPPAPFDVGPGPDATTASIHPVGALSPGTTYRFALTDGNGTDLGSWAFAVKQPLHVVTTLPDNMSTDVPLDTGIEITFDQDGAMDVASHVTFEPALTGHTETHGRTFVFVPDQLTSRTLYTVTVRAGIGIAGSDQVLARDVHFAFETGIPESTVPPVSISAERVVMEASPHERTTMVVDVDVPDGAKPVTTLPVKVYRLGSQSAALAALRGLTDAPTWARYSRKDVVDTSGLARVASFTATLADFGQGSYPKWFRFPTALPRGWYVVDVERPDRDLQVFLQVTDLATYAAITSTRSVVWVNDTSTHAAAPAATVTLAGGARLGLTDKRGLLVAATPQAVLDRLAGADPALDAPILVIRASNGRTALAPAGLLDGEATHYISDITGTGTIPQDTFFHLLYTDRTLYRQTDQVNVWGLVRSRDRAALPGKVVLRLLSQSSYGDGPSIVTVPVTLGPTGSFQATIPLKEMPIGPYAVELSVGPIDLAGTGFSVDLIRKPAYQIKVSTDRHAVLIGSTVAMTAKVTFYEGTPAPDTDIAATGFDYGNDGDKTATTNATGVALFALPAVMETGGSGYELIGLGAHPVGPEEGDVAGGSSVMVFQSSLWLDGKVVVSGGRLKVSGSVHDVDFSGLEKHATEIAAADYSVALDPRGRARPGIAVDASIVEIVPVKTFAGRSYDYIAKRAVDTYTYSTRERSLGMKHLRSGADGRIHLSMAVDRPSHGFVITLTAPDSKRRIARLVLEAEAPPAPASAPDLRPHLSGASSCGYDTYNSASLAVGQTIRTTMVDGRGSLPTGGANRYLFLTAQRGLHSAAVQTSPRFSQAFTNADVPNLSVLGVRFTGDTYAPAVATYRASFESDSRALSIHLSMDAPSYRPGSLVTLTIETRDAAGKLVPATVTLRAVDQKLYAIGGAQDVDPLADLYTDVSSGIVQTHASRTDVYPESDGGCGATGGGDREDFRDSVLFRTVATNTSGRATVTFKVADDLTSWHLSASAVTASLQAGTGNILIPVGLPFFAEVGLAPEYLIGDRPSVRVRAFGSALKSGDPVTFTVSSTTLPMAATTVSGTAFQPIDIALPTLHLGDQSLTISATIGSGAAARTDTLTRHFSVVATRLLTTQTRSVVVTAGLAPAHGDGMTTYTFSDAGRGQYLAFLEDAAGSDGARLDQALAKVLADELIARYFPSAAVEGSGATDNGVFDAGRYESDRGLALLPYSGADLELTADAALVAPDRFHFESLNNALGFALDQPAPDVTRERRIIALAGLAGLGRPVLADVRAAAKATDLSPIEQLYLGLAAAALGDTETAVAMETAVLHGSGQRQGPWVRLGAGLTGDAAIHATALLAMLAAKLGDPVAGAADAYVSSHPTMESVTALLGIGYVQAAIAHASAAKASYAYTVDGVRRVVDLAPGESARIVLTASQAASLRVEPVGGKAIVTSSWEAPADLTSTPLDPMVKSLTRTWSPAGDVRASSVVAVTITLEIQGDLAVNECYDVTDLAPSGLAPLSALRAWPLMDDNGDPMTTQSDVIEPYAIEGQRVRFCATPQHDARTMTMRYYLRVVTTGSYLWEPALAGSSLAPNGVAHTDPVTLVVR